MLCLLFVSIQIGQSQESNNWLKSGTILTLLHIYNQPDVGRSTRIDFLNNVYFPVIQEALPGTFSFHLEGIDGERSGQHVRFTLIASEDIQDKYFKEEGQKIGMTKEARELWDKATEDLPHEKIGQLFKGWDFSIFNFWKIISATPTQTEFSGLQGWEIAMYYLIEEHDSRNQKWEKQMAKKLRNLSKGGSQLFLLFSEGGTRKGSYAIMELHQSGQSQKEAITDSELNLEPRLFSTYRIW